VEQKAIHSLEEVDITLREFRASMDEINDKLTRVTEDFTDIKKISIPAIDNLMETIKNFNRVTLKFEKSLDRGDYNAKMILEPTIVDMGILTEEVSALTRDLKQSPSDIFFKSRKPRRGPGE
jgi:phospholipid/cholesterol/gamma-HCH transport system substrate-binding protein